MGILGHRVIGGSELRYGIVAIGNAWVRQVAGQDETQSEAIYIPYLWALTTVGVAWRCHARPRIQQLRGFGGVLFVAVLLILLRCVYRVVELQAGYFSAIVFQDEPLFIAFESGLAG